jgi:hypothetical protein
MLNERNVQQANLPNRAQHYRRDGAGSPDYEEAIPEP